MNENLPRIASIFIIIIGVFVCIGSILTAVEFNSAASEVWVSDAVSTSTELILIGVLFGVANIILGVMLLMWDSERKTRASERGRFQKEAKENFPPPSQKPRHKR